MHASFPFVEDFESGALADCWSVSMTDAGRTVVSTTNLPNGGTYHLLMDSSVDGTYSLNELVLTIDLAGRSGVLLSFYCKEFGDESEVMPLSFAGSSNSDGVAVSADGVTWYRAADLASTVTSVYQRFNVDLDALCLASGISYNAAFKIKFQQYDNFAIATDGFAFDDIAVQVAPPPTITARPSDAIVTELETAAFAVLASSLVSVSFQWRKDGVDIPGATASGYMTPPTTLADDCALFTCVVTNAGGSVTSNAAVLWVNMAPPMIVTQPVDQTTYENETATFTVVATGSAPLAYQWRRDGVNVPGATSASYVTPAATPADDGAVFTCVVTNARGSVTSFPATLTVLPPFVSVTAPNGGETWYFDGPDETIAWTSGGVTGNVDIHYSVNGGGPPWKSVATDLPNTGLYAWTIPDEDSANCVVRVREPGGGNPSDDSDATFTISPPAIELTAPNGGETWYQGGTRGITWTNLGGVGNVDIQYSVDGGGAWTGEAIGVPNTGLCTWTVPDVDSTDCLVRVQETGGAGPTDESDAVFTITSVVASFADDFEDGDFAGWTNGTGVCTREVTDVAAAAGSTYSFSITGSCSHYEGVSHALADITPSQINLYVRSSGVGTTDGYFVTGVGTALSDQAIFFYMNGTGHMMVVNGTVTPTYVANQWYLVSFVLDWGARAFDFHVDGLLVEAGIPFRGPTVDRLSVVYLYNWSNSQAWWDEIEFLF